MFDPHRHLETMRARPEEERVALAFAGALGVAGLIFLIWGVFFLKNVRTPTQQRVQEAVRVEQAPQEQHAVSDTVNSVLNEPDQPYEPLPDDSSSEPLPVELVPTPEQTQKSGN